MTRSTPPSAASFLAPSAPARAADPVQGKISAATASTLPGEQTGFAANLETSMRGAVDGAETTRVEAEYRLLKRKKQARLLDSSSSTAHHAQVNNSFAERRSHAAPAPTGKAGTAADLSASSARSGLPSSSGAGTELGADDRAQLSSGGAPLDRMAFAHPDAMGDETRPEPEAADLAKPDAVEDSGRPALLDTGAEREPQNPGPGTTSRENISAADVPGYQAPEPAIATGVGRPSGADNTDRIDRNSPQPGNPGTQTLRTGDTVVNSAGAGNEVATPFSGNGNRTPEIADPTLADHSVTADQTVADTGSPAGNDTTATSAVHANAAPASPAQTQPGGPVASERARPASGNSAQANVQTTAGAAITQSAKSQPAAMSNAVTASAGRGSSARTEGSAAANRASRETPARNQRIPASRTSAADTDANLNDRATPPDKTASLQNTAAAARTPGTAPTMPAGSEAVSPAEASSIADTPIPVDVPVQAGELAAIDTPLDPALVSDEFRGELGDRLVQAIRMDMNNAEIRITPEDLGPIRIELNMDGDTANVSFSADQGATRQALQDSMGTLRDMLSSEGWTLGQADVRDNPGNGQMGDRRSAQADERSNRNTTAGGSDGDPLVHESRYTPPRQAQSLVDLFA